MSKVFPIKGEGRCSSCNTKQRIATKYTAAMVAAILIIFLFFPISVLAKIGLSILVGILYLLFSKTSPDKNL